MKKTPDTSWNDSDMSWADLSEALEARRVSLNDEPERGATLLVDRDGDGSWEEATEQDVEDNEAYGWQVTDADLTSCLTPDGEWLFIC